MSVDLIYFQSPDKELNFRRSSKENYFLKAKKTLKTNGNSLYFEIKAN